LVLPLLARLAQDGPANRSEQLCYAIPGSPIRPRGTNAVADLNARVQTSDNVYGISRTGSHPARPLHSHLGQPPARSQAQTGVLTTRITL